MCPGACERIFARAYGQCMFSQSKVGREPMRWWQGARWMHIPTARIALGARRVRPVLGGAFDELGAACVEILGSSFQSTVHCIVSRAPDTMLLPVQGLLHHFQVFASPIASQSPVPAGCCGAWASGTGGRARRRRSRERASRAAPLP